MAVEPTAADGAGEQAGEGVNLSTAAQGVTAFGFVQDGEIGGFVVECLVLSFTTHPLGRGHGDAFTVDGFVFAEGGDACIKAVGDDAFDQSLIILKLPV